MLWKLLLVFCAFSSQTTRLEGSDSLKTLSQLFQKYEKIWNKRNCTFPDPSTYTKLRVFGELNNLQLSNDDPSPTDQTDSEIPLQPCQDPDIILSSQNKTIQQNSTVNVCVALFKVSLPFCKKRAGLEETLKKDNLDRLTTQFQSSSVCSILVSKKYNFNFLSFLTTSEETCQNQCEKNNILAPVCRLLTAALIASDTGNDAEKHSSLETTTALSTERTPARSEVIQPSKPPPNRAVKSTSILPLERNVTEVMMKNESSSPKPDVNNHKISSTQSYVTTVETSSIENKGSPETSTEKTTVSTEQSETESPPESTAGEVGEAATTMDSVSQNTTLKQISKNDKNQVTNETPTTSENSAAKNAPSNEREPSEMTKDASDKSFDQDGSKENMADEDGSTVQILLWLSGFLIVGMVVLLLYNNRQTIQNCAMKYKTVSRSLWQETGSKVKYTKLMSVEDAIPNLKKSVQAKNHMN